MKSNNYLIGLSILFFVLAAAFSVVFWADVSLAARTGFFSLGFGSGVTAGQWYARRSAQAPDLHRLITEAIGRSWQPNKRMEPTLLYQRSIEGTWRSAS